MAKNTANMNAGAKNPALARVDIRDMCNALGYDDTGALTTGTAYALAEKLNYTLATSTAALTGNMTISGTLGVTGIATLTGGFTAGGNSSIGAANGESGTIGHDGALLVGGSVDGEYEALTLANANGGVGETNQSVSLGFKLTGSDVYTSLRDAGKILVGKDDAYQSGATQDGFMAFYTMQNGILTEAGRFDSNSNLTLTSQLTTATSTPASASATGTTGTWAWDSNYIYICTATDTWKRVAIATW